MKVEELRVKTESELKELIVDSKRELMNLRFQRVTGQLASSARFRSLRRDVSRVKTILRERAQKIVSSKE